MAIFTIGGRYYGMDRDNNFDSLKLAYDAICYGKGKNYNNYKELIEDSYNNGKTDEFIIPALLKDHKELSDNDGVITFNFRKDRLRELFTLLSNPDCYEKDANSKGLVVKHYKNLKTLTMFPVTETVLSPHAFNDQDLKKYLRRISS